MNKNIIFIHGMFQNATSWNHWINYFGRLGYHCLAASWPGHEGDPTDLRGNIPPGLGSLHLQAVIGEFAKLAAQHPGSTLIGHSVGGLVVQSLVNSSLGGAGVCISSVAPNKMLTFDWGFFRNSMSIANPLKGDEPVLMTPEVFHNTFANTMTREASDVEYMRTATHDSRNILRDCLSQDGHVDLGKPHAPLLFIGGDQDQIIPAELNAKNAGAYTDADSIVSYKSFAKRGHYICNEPGWEEVAKHIHHWLEWHVGTPEDEVQAPAGEEAQAVPVGGSGPEFML